MASRRLKSDRFIATCYTPEYYTKEGLEWIADNNMRTLLLRHSPELAPALQDSKNAFAPWRRISGARHPVSAGQAELKSTPATTVPR
jgi:hypothetical protein